MAALPPQGVFETCDVSKDLPQCIDRQRQLDEITGEKLKSGLSSLVFKDDGGKKHRQSDPNATPDPSFSVSYRVSFSIQEAEIQAQHEDDKETKP